MNLNIAALLEAAEYLERREREAEHGYASTFIPASHDDDLMQTKRGGRIHHNSTSSSIGSGSGINISNNKDKQQQKGGSKLNKKSQGNRTTHNELEKNRRAHLRGCLEKLKELVPLGGDSNRHTTLGLLNKAKGFIRNLEEKEKKAKVVKNQLVREQRYLLRRLEQLNAELNSGSTSLIDSSAVSTGSNSSPDSSSSSGFSSSGTGNGGTIQRVMKKVQGGSGGSENVVVLTKDGTHKNIIRLNIGSNSGTSAASAIMAGLNHSGINSGLNHSGVSCGGKKKSSAVKMINMMMMMDQQNSDCNNHDMTLNRIRSVSESSSGISSASTSPTSEVGTDCCVDLNEPNSSSSSSASSILFKPTSNAGNNQNQGKQIVFLNPRIPIPTV